ncbi:hypothetical protein AMELA_G00027440 [Ameiurus melas]|uniref:Uncharacterized protein n=1 Tax=Ameiurus melas TaxID=219545 RepID=A0A7J6BGJ3_AMEME|nr:hypothetical protein AMELA_G00027440 [Ameiurus melas]
MTVGGWVTLSCPEVCVCVCVDESVHGALQWTGIYSLGKGFPLVVVVVVVVVVDTSLGTLLYVWVGTQELNVKIVVWTELIFCILFLSVAQ